MKKLFIVALLSFALASCTKDGVHSRDPFYFKGTVNGQSIKWEAPFVDYGSSVQPQFQAAMPTLGGYMPQFFCSNTPLRYQGKEGTSIFENERNTTVTKNSISVTFAQSYEQFTDTREGRSWFTNGRKSFGLLRGSCDDPIIDGIIISYNDANGKRWESSWGDQSEGVVEQIALQDETRTQTYKKKWTVRFSCKLYDGNGNFIELKDCEIYGPVFPI